MCRLNWSESIEQAVIAASQTSQSIAAKWRKTLNDDQIALVTRFLNQSTMKKCWPEEAP